MKIDIEKINLERGTEIFGSVLEDPYEMMMMIVDTVNSFASDYEVVIDEDLFGSIFIDFFEENAYELNNISDSYPATGLVISNLMNKNTVYSEDDYLTVCDALFSILEVNFNEFKDEVLAS